MGALDRSNVLWSHTQALLIDDALSLSIFNESEKCLEAFTTHALMHHIIQHHSKAQHTACRDPSKYYCSNIFILLS